MVKCLRFRNKQKSYKYLLLSNNMKKRLCIFFMLLIVSAFVFAEKQEVQVPIYKGWNLVYGFSNPKQLVGGLEPRYIKAIYAFIPKIQDYARVYPKPESSKFNIINENELSQTAFWVYSRKTVKGSLKDTEHSIEYWAEEPMPFYERQMYAGWNFVGVTLDMVNTKEQSDSGNIFHLKDLAGTCKILRAYGWGPEKKQWKDIIDEDPTRDWIGLGIVLKVEKNCKLDFPPDLRGICIDSDSGLDYGKRGTITIAGETKTDYCDGNILIEYTCHRYSLESKNYTCPSGCGYGRCMQEGECILYEVNKKDCRYDGTDYIIEIFGGGCGSVPVEMKVSYETRDEIRIEELSLAQGQEKTLENDVVIKLVGSPCAENLIYIELKEED